MCVSGAFAKSIDPFDFVFRNFTVSLLLVLLKLAELAAFPMKKSQFKDCH